MNKKFYGWGPLFQHDLNYDGKWIKDIIQKISDLSFVLKKSTKDNPNGIYVGSTKTRYYKIVGGFLSEEREPPKLGIDIARFVVSTYITKQILRYNPQSGEKFTTPSTINIVLNEINNENIITNEVIHNIMTILNHPHFKGCNNIDDIQEKISLVPPLNNRFKGQSCSSHDEEEEDEEKEQVIIHGLSKDNPKNPEFFFDDT